MPMLDPAVIRLSGAVDEKRAPQPVPTRSRRWSISAMASRRPPPRSPPPARSAGEGAETAQLIRLGLKELGEVSDDDAERRPDTRTDRGRAPTRSASAIATTGRRSARRCARARARSSPASASTPISAAWRSAPRPSRSARRSPMAGETGIDTIVAVRHPPPDGKGPADRGGVALRRLPRADLGLRSQRARHRAGAERA